MVTRIWAEYDSTAEWCAKRHLDGELGSLLPENLSVEVLNEINNHPEEFAQRVRDMAYSLNMEQRKKRNVDDAEAMAEGSI